MKLFGFEIRRIQKAAPTGLGSILANRGGWLPIIRESFAGAWQTNVTVDRNTIVTSPAIFACMTLIASDIAKCRLRLVERDGNGIWNEVENPAYSPVLRKPNAFQTRNQFWEHYVLSKLANGNVYVLKGRDARGVVTSLNILDPMRVQPLVAEDGEVFYQLNSDNIAGLRTQVTVPASEIIHDRMNCLFHPLVGISPITAAALAATQSLNIQRDYASFFGNRSVPGGVLTHPDDLSEDDAKKLKEEWESNFGGSNSGKTAVLANGLKFEPMRVTAHDAQVVEQLKWTAEVVCSVFHVPLYKIGAGPIPSVGNVQALNLEYYSQALQMLIESAESAMDDGLRTGDKLGVEFDTSDLLRMDELTQIQVAKEGVGAGILSPNEARKRINHGPVEGGEFPVLQQQNWPLPALAKRPAPTGENPNPAPDDKPTPLEAEDENPADAGTEDEITRGILAGYFSEPRLLPAPEHA